MSLIELSLSVTEQLHRFKDLMLVKIFHLPKKSDVSTPNLKDAFYHTNTIFKIAQEDMFWFMLIMPENSYNAGQKTSWSSENFVKHLEYFYVDLHFTPGW